MASKQNDDLYLFILLHNSQTRKNTQTHLYEAGKEKKGE